MHAIEEYLDQKLDNKNVVLNVFLEQFQTLIYSKLPVYDLNYTLLKEYFFR